MRRDDRPYPGATLKKNLFHDYPSHESFERLSSGLKACIDNSHRLISDTKILLENERYSSAKFILTTAKEELSKTLILSDLCKLDIEKHNSTAKKLCRAFYDHISKHAYYEIVTFPRKNLSMGDLKEIWKNETKKYWISVFESDGPDMPHDTYFNRELPLYVDYSDYDNNWLIPCNEFNKHYFKSPTTDVFGNSDLTDLEKIANLFKKEMNCGLLEPGVLKLISENTKKHYINDKYTSEGLRKIFDKTANVIFEDFKISREQFLSSKIHYRFPLYSFVSET